jgi:hypothetical protein
MRARSAIRAASEEDLLHLAHEGALDRDRRLAYLTVRFAPTVVDAVGDVVGSDHQIERLLLQAAKGRGAVETDVAVVDVGQHQPTPVAEGR